MILLVSTFSFSQLSKNHYIPPISSGPSNADPLDQLMYISTPNQGDVNFTINIVGGNSISGTVSNATPYVYGIADSGYSSFVQDPATTSRVTSDKGYIINADSPIYVSVRLNAGGTAQAGALVSKGENALGTTFRIGTYDSQRQGAPGPNYLNFFSFMATPIINVSTIFEALNMISRWPFVIGSKDPGYKPIICFIKYFTLYFF